VHSTLELSEIDKSIGRLFMSGMPGTKLDRGTEALIRDFCLGGVILFSRNIENPVQLASLCRDLQEKARKYHGSSLFLAVDQEGGPVARLKEPFTRFPGNSAIGEDENPQEKAVEFARVTATEMKLVGLNMNLAPVLDVRGREVERHLAGRTFCGDPEKVALLGRVVIRELQAHGIMAVAKHFPGLGRAPLDPHRDLPIIDAGAGEMEQVHLSPFRAAIEEGVSAVMTSHAVYPALDPDLPATLSRSVLTALLREELGFQGLIITDDLEMGAIEKTWGVPQGAMVSLQAGGDLLLICKDQNLVMDSILALRGKVIRGDIPFSRIYESMERIGKLKSRYLKKKETVSLERVRAYFHL